MTLYSPQIVKTLADQVQNLAPLRDSFHRLEQYYLKLTQDFDDLLRYSDHSEKELLTNLKYLEEVHRCLEREFGNSADELRQLECQQAKIHMEKNQCAVQAEALKSRELLELEERANLEGRRNDLIEQNEKLAFTVSKYKEMVHNLELAIKSKEYENLDIEREIKKMELVNQKIRQLNNQAENNIDVIQKESGKGVEEIYQLECKLGTYEKLIEVKERQNKESFQNLIANTEELEQLKHRKDYIEKLVEAELCEQRELTKTYGELDSILGVKKDQLMFASQENREYEKLIREQKDEQDRSKEELLKLKAYLQTLVATNETLFQQLQRSCSQDRDVQVMLSQKLQKLIVINDKIAQNDILNRCDVNSISTHHYVPKEKMPSSKRSPPKDLPAVHASVLNKLSSPKGQKSTDVRSFVRSNEMSSTWGSRSKENLFTDL